MNPVLILEGCDGAGKTRLAEHLAGLGWRVQHEGPPRSTGNLLHYYGQKLVSAVRGRTPVVLDRFHIGETIYGPVARGVDRITTHGLRLFDRICRAYGIKMLLCVPPYAVCLRNWRRDLAEDNDYLRDQARFHEVYYRYYGLLPYYQRFDYTRDPDYRRLDGYLKNAGPLLPLGVIGSLNARYLIIGEQVNHPSLDLPWFSLNGSSAFLNSALAETGFTENEMAFTNVLKPNGDYRDLERVYESLPLLKTVIAFGRLAEREAKSYWPSTYPMRHPSCWKRFRYDKRGEFVKELRRIREDL